jgi:hypothetical protein
MEVSGHLHALAALPPGKEHQSWSGRGGEEKKSYPLPGLDPPIIQPVTQDCTSDLSRLLIANG